MEWIPSWLASTYARLLLAHGTSAFSSGGALRSTGLERAKLNLSLSRLAFSGWLVRLQKGNYIALDPLAIVSAIDGGWASRFDPEALQVIQVALSEIFRTYSFALVSVALFGSLTRGEWKETSDIDLLVVADGLPKKYSERMANIERVLKACSSVRSSQWKSKMRYHLVEMIVLERRELEGNELFLLDLTRDAVILYDKDAFLASRLRELSRELEGKAVRIETPSGSRYWDLKGLLRG